MKKLIVASLRMFVYPVMERYIIILLKMRIYFTGMTEDEIESVMKLNDEWYYVITD